MIRIRDEAAMMSLTDVVNPELETQAGQLRGAFDNARPFRHLCIDGFLTRFAADKALSDFPSFKAENAINEFGEVGGKAVETKLGAISPFYQDLFGTIVSQPFLDLMSRITGIPDLLPDPTMFGGGTYENRDGQELDPHVDFNRMEDLSAYRRLNLLIYLNHEWKAEWGGSIELHSNPRDPASNRISAFEPIFNRAVIFETSEFSWHGFPKIRLPADKKHLSRKSLSIYFYTRTRPVEEIEAPHATFYVQRPLTNLLEPGRALTPNDVADLKEAIARRDSWIEFYQKQETALTKQIENGRNFLNEVLGRLCAPITGYGLQEGAIEGLYHDRWVGPRFAVTIRPKRPVRAVTVHGWVPDEMAESEQLTIQAAGQTLTGGLKSGTFDWTIELEEATTADLPISVTSTGWITPEGEGARKLVFVLREIELEH
jgi:2OG-Fe(II) oxygenase superfamily